MGAYAVRSGTQYRQDPRVRGADLSPDRAKKRNAAFGTRNPSLRGTLDRKDPLQNRFFDSLVSWHLFFREALMTILSNNANMLIRWILGTTLGPFVGFVFLFGYLAYDSYKWTIIVPMGFIVIGILLGIGQWVVLRTHLINVWTWIPLTAIGFILGVFIGLFSGNWINIDGWNPSIPVAVGASMGIFQWPVFSKQVRRSIWWIPASIISWTIGLGIPLVVFDLTTSEHIWSNYLLILYGASLGLLWGILVGLISGIFLIFLISKSVSKRNSG